jgi:tetratricopeptide (TPR) repeat protein
MATLPLSVFDPCTRKSKYFTPDCQIHCVPAPLRLCVQTVRTSISRVVCSVPVIAVILLCLPVFAGFGQTAGSEDKHAQAAEHFVRNEPEKARVLFEEILRGTPEDVKPDAYLYLGVIYEQLGEHQKAVEVMTEGLDVPGVARDMLFFNIGNNYLRLQDRQSAIDHYTHALEENSGFSQAYLNRANLRVREQVYQKAIDDYEAYLGLEPETSQRNEIERMIALLRTTIDEERRAAEEEQKRREEEAEQARQAEERRREEEEARRLAAEQRRRELLDSVLDSLEGSGREGRSLSAPGEDMKDLEDAFDIAD